MDPSDFLTLNIGSFFLLLFCISHSQYDTLTVDLKMINLKKVTFGHTVNHFYYILSQPKLVLCDYLREPEKTNVDNAVSGWK